ncbi:xanthine dehydrogenase accessory protein XdhC [soil metagenome]
MPNLRDTAKVWLAARRAAVVVEVTQSLGSVPREGGTRMLVAAQQTAGTIGGGHLELKAIAEAREMLAEAARAGRAAAPQSRAEMASAGQTPAGEHAFMEADADARAEGLRIERIAPRSAHYPLGPALGQCCGGAVTLGFSLLDAAALTAWPETAPRFHLQLYGAGHVGRAIARALAPLHVLVDWIDEREEEFPASFHAGDFAGAGAAWPAHIRKVCVDGVDAEVRSAPAGAFYLVLTHQHDLDLQITEAVLRRGDFGFLGLIGSKTKKRRFIHRFEQRGIAPDVIERMTCPIGLEGIDGKEPEVIAASVVAQLLRASPVR